jgi:hypothetical protein
VYVSGTGTFIITGGNISENYAAVNGGGVYVGMKRGAFTMTGGRIGDNKAAANGGGAYILGANTFVMEGGKLSGNAASAKGGGAFVDMKGTFIMLGGEISGNTATSGGGVFVGSRGSFTKGRTSGVIYGSDERDIVLRNSAADGQAAGVIVKNEICVKKRDKTADEAIELYAGEYDFGGGWE